MRPRGAGRRDREVEREREPIASARLQYTRRMGTHTHARINLYAKGYYLWARARERGGGVYLQADTARRCKLSVI